MAGETNWEKPTAADFCSNDTKEIEEAYQLGGAAGFARILQEHNERWKTVPLNIAVIGQSGVGKSSYINCSRNITAEDEEGAQVDIVECTEEVRSYAHPDNALLLYWDCPGVGTPKFPRGTYLEKIGFKRYDFYLLLSSSRFTDDDQWLAAEIGKLGKRFFYVRTQSGVDVFKQRTSHPRSTVGQSDDEILQKVRKDIVTKLELKDAEQDNIFLIDSYQPAKFDFCKLQDTLLTALPDLKREAFLYSLSPMGMLSKKILQKKVDALRGRIWKMALASGVVGLLPIPGISTAFDIGMVIAEGRFYQQQLGLDQQSLTSTAQTHKVDVTLLEETVALSIPGVITKDFVFFLSKELATETAGQAMEELLKFIPFLGSLVVAPLSYVLTRRTLLAVLDKMETAAHNVIDICVNKAHQQALEETREDCENLRNKKPAI